MMIWKSTRSKSSTTASSSGFLRRLEPRRLLFGCLMIAEATPWMTTTSHGKNPALSFSTTQQRQQHRQGQQSSNPLATTLSLSLNARASSSSCPRLSAASGARPLVSPLASSLSSTTEQTTSTAGEGAALGEDGDVNAAGTSAVNSVQEEETVPENSSEKAGDGDGNDDVKILVDHDAFLKPNQDSRQYRIVQLRANNLIALLVSDQLPTGQVGVEAAAVHVQCGHFDDTVAGLAHFHEHMLFLGTQKYPAEDEYETFLSQYGGGSSNAYTDMEDTNYYFSLTTPQVQPNVTSAGLTGALDRLAQFFVAPKFDPNAVDREIQAIDSEYRNGKTSDAWRNYQALKAFANPLHPFAKFGCGNSATLQDAVSSETLLRELQTFWDTYYQTYNLRLAVVGHASLDALQQTVVETFGQLAHSEGEPRYNINRPKLTGGDSAPENGNVNGESEATAEASAAAPVEFVREGVSGRHEGVTAFARGRELGLIRTIVPLLEARSVKVHFAVPPLDDPALQSSKPHRVLSHLLGHESPGSLHCLLHNDLGYVEHLSAGSGIDASDFGLFTLNLNLTPQGMQHLDQVLDWTFQWIALVRRADPATIALHHDEMRQWSEVNFQFREIGNPTDFVSNAADLLFNLDENISSGNDNDDKKNAFLMGSTRTGAYDPVVAKAFLDRLVPENALIVVTNSDLTVDPDNDSAWDVEPWYGAPHKQQAMSKEQMQQWESPERIDDRLYLPALNAYIPTDFSLKCEEEEEEDAAVESAEEKRKSSVFPTPPVPLVDNDKLRLWHKMDREWRVPKALIRLSILTPDVYRSPRSMTYNRIFQRMLNDDLNSYVYDASLAGCHYRVSCTPTGWRISVRGYSQTLPVLLDTLTARIFSLLDEMRNFEAADGSGAESISLATKFEKAKDSLCRETKNYRLDVPYEVASYQSRLLLEESVWYIDNYIDEMEGGTLSLQECASVVHECITSRVKCEALCMGNLNATEAHGVGDLITQRFLPSSRVLSHVEMPSFRSLQLPTKQEAARIFGPAVAPRSPNIPLIYADRAYSETEDNSAVELILQVGSELEMGYQGLAVFDLICHLAYNSAYNQLRTVEQLGYIVSVFSRRTAGNVWGMSIVVQGSRVSPAVLEERMETWLHKFRTEELAALTPEAVAAEAGAVAAQLLERDTKLSHEVSHFWGEILNTEGFSPALRTPAFDRLERLCEELVVGDPKQDDTNGEREDAAAIPLTGSVLKDHVLQFFDQHLAAESPHRRAMSARIYSHNFTDEFQETVQGQLGVLSSYDDIDHVKQFLPSWPLVPYWRRDSSTATTTPR